MRNLKNYCLWLLALVLGFSTAATPVAAITRPEPYHDRYPGYPSLEDCGSCKIERNTRSNLLGSVITTRQTMLYLVPITQDFQLEPDRAGMRMHVQPGMRFEIARAFKLLRGKYSSSSYGLLANTYGGKYLAVLLLAENSQWSGADYVQKQTQWSPTVTYIAGAEDIYPNKVENVIMAFKNLSAYQDRREGFKAEAYISTLRAFGFYSYQAFQAYKAGALATGINAPAGGVCAAATGLASLAYLTPAAKLIDIVHHDKNHLYFQGLFSPPALSVDSGISIRPDGSFEELGFKMPKAGYFKIQAQLLPNGIAFAETDPEGLGGLSDVVLLLSLSFDEKETADQTEALEGLIAAYQKYRASGHQQLPALMSGMEFEQLDHSGVLQANLEKALAAAYLKP